MKRITEGCFYQDGDPHITPTPVQASWPRISIIISIPLCCSIIETVHGVFPLEKAPEILVKSLKLLPSQQCEVAGRAPPTDVEGRSARSAYNNIIYNYIYI